MSAALAKICKIGEAKPTEIEKQIAQALYDLEVSTPDLKADLRFIQITAASEVDTTGGRKAIVIFVPYTQLKDVHKIQARITRELEKKFSDKHVFFVAQRSILPKPKPGKNQLKQKRPRSRTLTKVHEAMLQDVVYPTEILGKRVRQGVDGKRLLKVRLDAKDSTLLDHKLESIASVYSRLSGKLVKFEIDSTK